MSTKIANTRRPARLSVRMERRPEIDLDKLALALLRLARTQDAARPAPEASRE